MILVLVVCWQVAWCCGSCWTGPSDTVDSMMTRLAQLCTRPFQSKTRTTGRLYVVTAFLFVMPVTKYLILHSKSAGVADDLR